MSSADEQGRKPCKINFEAALKSSKIQYILFLYRWCKCCQESACTQAFTLSPVGGAGFC